MLGYTLCQQRRYQGGSGEGRMRRGQIWPCARPVRALPALLAGAASLSSRRRMAAAINVRPVPHHTMSNPTPLPPTISCHNGP
eukprot:38292-Chlamydomonas_euryale.AAC.1